MYIYIYAFIDVCVAFYIKMLQVHVVSYFGIPGPALWLFIEIEIKIQCVPFKELPFENIVWEIVANLLQLQLVNFVAS